MQKPKMEKGTEGQEEERGFQNGKSRRMILFCLRRALPFKSQAFGWRAGGGYCVNVSNYVANTPSVSKPWTIVGEILCIAGYVWQNHAV